MRPYASTILPPSSGWACRPKGWRAIEAYGWRRVGGTLNRRRPQPSSFRVRPPVRPPSPLPALLEFLDSSWTTSLARDDDVASFTKSEVPSLCLLIFFFYKNNQRQKRLTATYISLNVELLTKRGEDAASSTVFSLLESARTNGRTDE